MRLSEGDRVCVIGGGPAGSFAALHLLKAARKLGLKLEVLIFEPRNFSNPGPGGCNSCAGILSSRLLEGLESLGLSLPHELIQAELTTYALHLDDVVVQLEQPDPQRKIISVYRGAGPRLSAGEPIASFDKYLLEQAILRGAKHIPSRVRKVVWEEKPVVHTARDRISADLLVLATGVNSRPPMSPEFGYQPPKTVIMAQDEMLTPDKWSPTEVGVFFRDPPGLIFGALIPKGRYLNISLLGSGFNKDTIRDFLELHDLDLKKFSSFSSLCGCTPRIAVSPARRYYGSRWVAVGDAAVTRLYKDGIGSAFLTAKIAMQVAVQDGISSQAFNKGYLPHCRRVARDNFFGRMLFQMWNLTLNNRTLTRIWRLTMEEELSIPPEKRMNMRLLWGLFTGDEQYRDLFRLILSLKSMRAVMRGLQTGISRRFE
ncbi:MAG: NAD(P)/FAD-dependent oxidoreductase [Chloroflexi bacterium]|nr:NAD(P)/FAD-dependent oxidoreductase [Chloroflexota bacterium]